jgi:DNA polymerase-3 subunit delta'
MYFDDIVGNIVAKSCLTRMLESGRVGNCLLFAGPEGIGKGLFAQAFSKALLNQAQNSPHPDLHIYRPEGKIGMHSISSMRQFIEEVHLPPYQTKRKIFILHDAERMLPDSANALLKTFEEPTLDSLILLISSSPQLLLPTILSRCQVLHFQPLSHEEITSYLMTHCSKSPEEADHLASQAVGSLTRALSLNVSDNELRKSLLEILSKQPSYPELLKALRGLNDQLEAKKKVWAEQCRKEVGINEKDKNLSAAQLEAIQKELDGLVSLKTLREVETLFEAFLAWHRDLHLVATDSSLDLLIHKDYRQALISQSQLSRLTSLEYVMKQLSAAKMAFTRSIPFLSVMETLFLSLEN